MTNIWKCSQNISVKGSVSSATNFILNSAANCLTTTMHPVFFRVLNRTANSACWCSFLIRRRSLLLSVPMTLTRIKYVAILESPMTKMCSVLWMSFQAVACMWEAYASHSTPARKVPISSRNVWRSWESVFTSFTWSRDIQAIPPLL